MGNAKWLYGKAIVNQVPQFFSVSQLANADEREGGCLRKWFYEMVLGRKSPQKKSAKRGDDTHEIIERYLKTGDRSFSDLVLKSTFLLPEPVKYDADGRPDMLVEHDMVRWPTSPAPKDEAEAAAALAQSPIKLEGIPVLGRMDLIHGRGTNVGGSDISEAYDPPGTVEVYDWKTAGTPEWIKKPADLPKTIQMAGYAQWVKVVEPDVKYIRLSHGYLVERQGPSRKVTLRVLPEDVDKTWEHATTVARRIRHAAQETNPDLVDANLRACDKYGGCYHKEVCKARMHAALSDFVGATKADELMGRETTMGLLDKMKALPANQAGAPAAAAAAPTTNPLNLGGMLGASAPAAPAQPDAAAIAAEKAKLEREEAEARAKAQLQELTDKLAPHLTKIEAYAAVNDGLGMPAFGGPIATAYQALRGKSCTPSGKLAGIAVDTFELVSEMSTQLDQLAGAGEIKPIPSATAPLAQLGGLLAPEAAAMPEKTQVATAPAGPPLPAAAQTTAPTPQAQIDTAGAAADEKAAGKKRAPKKDKSDEPVAKVTDGAFHLFVDQIDVRTPAPLQPIQPILDAIYAELVASTGDADVLCAGEKSPLAFAKWEGGIAAMIREKCAGLQGWYGLVTRGDRRAEVAARVLRELCQMSGGIFAWGGRS